MQKVSPCSGPVSRAKECSHFRAFPLCVTEDGVSSRHMGCQASNATANTSVSINTFLVCFVLQKMQDISKDTSNLGKKKINCFYESLLFQAFFPLLLKCSVFATAVISYVVRLSAVHYNYDSHIFRHI